MNLLDSARIHEFTDQIYKLPNGEIAVMMDPSNDKRQHLKGLADYVIKKEAKNVVWMAERHNCRDCGCVLSPLHYFGRCRICAEDYI